MLSLLLKPRLAGFVFALVLLLPGPLLLSLQLDNAPESYFPVDADAVMFDRSVREHFPQDQVLVALFSGPEVYSRQFLTALDDLALELERADMIERVVTATNVGHIETTDDGFRVEQLLGPRALSDSVSDNRTRALGDPFAPGLLVSKDGTSLAMIVRPTPLSGSLQRLALYNTVSDTIDQSDLGADLVALGGHIALDVAQLRAMIRDLAILIPGTLGISMLILWWLFRRWLVLIVSTSCISAVTGTAVALLAATGNPFTLVTAILPPLLTALTVAMLVHLFNALCHADARGMRGEARMRDALKAVSTPILFTALTTACGLLSLTTSPIRPIAAFGLTSAVATLVGALLIVIVLPALLLAFDLDRWRSAGAGFRGIDALTSRLLSISLRRPLVVLGVSAFVLVAGATQIPKIEVETDLYAFFTDSHPINQATRKIEGTLSGVMPLEIVLEGPAADSLKSPERLRAIAQVQKWLNEQPEVDYTASFTGLIEEMHRAFNGQDPLLLPLPDSSPLVEQYLLFYDGKDLDDVVEPEFKRTRILANLNVHGSRELNRLLDRIADEMASNPPADLRWNTAGMGRLFADQERLLIEGQINSLYSVAVMITLLMLVLWRNLRFTLISILPNFAPVLIIFAVMAILNIWLDMATAMVASVAIGIAIDDTIHLLHGIRSKLAAGVPLTPAVARTVKQRGRALVATTLVLCAQFLLVASSPFQPTAVFGALTAFGLLFALVFDLLVLPSLVVVVLRGSSNPSR